MSANTTEVSSDTSATITASYNGQTSVSFGIESIKIDSFDFAPNPITGGNAYSGTANFNGPVPHALDVTLTSDLSAISVPATLHISSGSWASFGGNSGGVDSDQVAHITASYGSSQKQADVTVKKAILSSVGTSAISIPSGNFLGVSIYLTGKAPTGGYVVSVSDDNSSTTTCSSMTIPAGQTSGTCSVTASAVSSLTTGTISASVAGVTVTNSITVVPATLSSISSVTVVGGVGATGTIYLNGKAPTGGFTVSVSTDNSAAYPIANVTVPSGSSSTTFSISTTIVPSDVVGTLTAQKDGVTKTAAITVTKAALLSLGAISTTTGGNSITGTVFLNGPTYNPLQLTLQSNNANVSVPNSVTVQSGDTQANFAITTSAVSSNASVIVTATSPTTASTSRTFALQVPYVLSVTKSPTGTMTGGTSATGTVTLKGPAPSGGTSVTLSSNNQYMTVPSTVNFTAGETSKAFTISTTNPSSNASVTLAATSYAANTISLGFTVLH